MNKKRQYASNRLFTLCFVLGLFFGWGSIGLLMEHDISGGLGLGVITLLLVVLPIIFSPYCYAFDSEGISLCYVFLPVERYLWRDVYAIEVEDTTTSSKSLIFEIFLPMFLPLKGNP